MSNFIMESEQCNLLVLSTKHYYSETKDAILEELPEGEQFLLEDFISQAISRGNPINEVAQDIVSLCARSTSECVLIGDDIPTFLVPAIVSELFLVDLTPAFLHDNATVFLGDE
jgi:hypothetical protein